MADTDYISVRRLRTFLAQMKQWVLGFTANRNTQAMSDVTVNTGISGTATIGKSITIHTASGAQTANVMNADMITNTEPSSNKDKVTKAPTYDLMENTVMTAISDAFDDITTIEYQVINNASQLPATGTNGVIYLAAIYSEVENPTGNPHDLGYYTLSNNVYTLTSDTSVQEGTTYYKKEDAYDEYIWLTPENRYEKLGQASIDISGLKFAGSATSGGSAYKTGAIPFGRVDSTSTSTDIKATVEGIDRLEDGTCVMLRNNVVTSAAGFTININGLGAHPSFNNMTNTTRDTTIFSINYTMLFVYDAEREVDGVTGAWCCYRGYNTNDNTIGYQVRTNSSTLPAKFKTYRYRLYFTSADGTHWVGANASTSTNATSSRTPTSEKINPFGPIIYYSTNGTTNASANLTATTIWQQYTVTLGYSFNHTGAALVLEYPKPVYLKCTPQSDGSVTIAGSNTVASYVQELPTTEDGFVYIFLGIAYAATTMELRLEHPVYYFKNGAIRLWTNQAAAEVEIKKYNYDRDESDEGTADYGQTDIIVNGDTSTIISTQSPPSSVRQYIAPSWRAMNQKLAEKADKANQGIADEPLAEQHSSTYDATVAAQIKIDTNSGSQSANVVQHDMVTGSITGTVNTDKTKIPTSAAVVQYVATHSAQADWDESDESDASYIQNKPDLSGFYSKPSGGIPKTDLASAVQTSLGKADTALQSFTESDPTVPSWAKASSKPTYTASEVGALPSTTVIPSKTSDLTNDSGFITGYTETDPVFTASAAHGITSSDISNWNSKTSNVGTITGITMNGASKGTSGVVDLGTVITAHQDISGKVDKVDGKGLSTNDYTTAEKTKLGGISEGAEVNVQSNWNETNSSSDAYIQNKPTIPTALADLTEDSSHKVVSQTSITTWNDKAEKVTQVNHGTSDTTYTITPNVLHVWGEVTSLNITLGTGENGVVNEYMFQFYSGNTPTTLTLPNSVIWVQPLTTQAGKTYQVSIVNNLACYITDGMAAAESSGGTPTYATQAWVTSLIDSVPTANSSNVPSSGGTYAMIEGGYYYN